MCKAGAHVTQSRLSFWLEPFRHSLHARKELHTVQILKFWMKHINDLKKTHVMEFCFGDSGNPQISCDKDLILNQIYLLEFW